MSSAPVTALEDCAHIALRYSATVNSNCELAGYYHDSPPTITLHRSAVDGRDNFTVLHEYGHHLQQHDDEWAMGVLAELPNFEARLLEERVSDTFASAVLFPDKAIEHLLGSTLTAKFVAELYNGSAASRAAACMKAIEVAPPSTEAMVVQLDERGQVLFARSNSDNLFVAPFGSFQEDFSRLFQIASERGGHSHGTAESGLRYSTGNSRNDLNIDMALDYSGTVGFAVVTPTYRFGTASWMPEERECSSNRCGEVFLWTAEIGVCLTCGVAKCPVCYECACERLAVAQCKECFMELSVAESSGGRVAHEECP
nr:ImmA/IrrE family metallo-endopeptidase [Leifsonia psychrotolerans]